MKTESQLRGLSEAAFLNFWINFTNEFQRLTAASRSEGILPQKIYDRIKNKIILISSRWEAGQTQGVAIEFWQLVGVARKFLKNL